MGAVRALCPRCARAVRKRPLSSWEWHTQLWNVPPLISQGHDVAKLTQARLLVFKNTLKIIYSSKAQPSVNSSALPTSSQKGSLFPCSSGAQKGHRPTLGGAGLEMILASTVLNVKPQNDLRQALNHIFQRISPKPGWPNNWSCVPMIGQFGLRDVSSILAIN